MIFSDSCACLGHWLIERILRLVSDSDETSAKSLLLQFRQLASATRSSSRVQHEFTVPCGFSTSFFTTGVYGVNFGFDLSKRFLSANASIANGHYFVAGASPTAQPQSRSRCLT